MPFFKEEFHRRIILKGTYFDTMALEKYTISVIDNHKLLR